MLIFGKDETNWEAVEAAESQSTIQRIVSQIGC